MRINDLLKMTVEPDGGECPLLLPMSGTVLPITEVPDAIFSQRLAGDGFAIEPSDGDVFSPVNGRVLHLFPAKNGIAILSDEGHEILIHVGVETAALKGEGFLSYVKTGDVISSKQLLLSVNLETVRLRASSLMTSVVFTNLGEKALELKKFGALAAGTEGVLAIK